jgi:hypothetical protein
LQACNGYEWDFAAVHGRQLNDRLSQGRPFMRDRNDHDWGLTGKALRIAKRAKLPFVHKRKIAIRMSEVTVAPH